MKNYLRKLQALPASRRFQLAVMGVVVVVFEDTLGMTTDQATAIAELIGFWIVGDSLLKTEQPEKPVQ